MARGSCVAEGGGEKAARRLAVEADEVVTMDEAVEGARERPA